MKWKKTKKVKKRFLTYTQILKPNHFGKTLKQQYKSNIKQENESSRDSSRNGGMRSTRQPVGVRGAERKGVPGSWDDGEAGGVARFRLRLDEKSIFDFEKIDL